MTDVESALWERERGFWTDGAEYYRDQLAGDVVMVFPGMVLDRQGAIEAIAAAPRWTAVAFDEQRSLSLAAGVVALQYRATARRDGDAQPYRALVTSVYVRRDGAWRLAVHQQTP